LAALDDTEDENLTSFVLRSVFSDHIGIPREGPPDLPAEAEQVFATKKPKEVKSKGDGSRKPKPDSGRAVDEERGEQEESRLEASPFWHGIRPEPDCDRTDREIVLGDTPSVSRRVRRRHRCHPLL